MTANGARGPTGSDSAELADAVSRGEPGAEDLLCARFGPGVQAMLLARGADHAASADLTQDVLLTVILRLRREPLDQPEKLAQFVRATGNWMLIAHLRKLSRQRVNYDSELVENAADGGPEPGAELASEQIRADLERWLGELKQGRDREILRRRFLLGEPKAATTESLGLTSSSYDVVVHRALRRLAQIATASVETE